MPEDQDVVQDSSPTEDVQTESSPEEQQEDLGEPTPEQGGQEEKEPPFNLHPRWQQMQEDKAKSEADAAYWKGMAEARQTPSTPQQPETDPYAGMDAQTRVFYEDLERRNNKLFDKRIAERERDYQAKIDALANSTAQLQEKMFRQTNTDVEPGSIEEKEIAGYIRMGMPPEKAAMAVLGEKRIKDAQRQTNLKAKTSPQVKAQANLNTSSVPQGSLPQKERLSFAQRLEKNMKEANI